MLKMIILQPNFKSVKKSERAIAIVIVIAISMISKSHEYMNRSTNTCWIISSTNSTYNPSIL